MLQPKNVHSQRTKTGKSTEGNFALSEKELNLIITSLEISEYTGKNHKELLRSIRSMEPSWEKVTERKFALSEYTDVTGRKLPLYEFDKVEYMYIISKFNDEIRAILVKRWYELEMELQQPKKGIALLEHETPLFEILEKWLVRGDLKKVAADLELTPNHISRVKRGIYRSHRVMEALIKKAKYNKDMGLSNGYSKNFSQLALELFNPQNSLSDE